MLVDRWVYIPLKMNLLVGEWYLFHTLIQVSFPERPNNIKTSFRFSFAQYMQYKTGNAFYRRHTRYEIEVIWGNTGVIPNKPSNAILDQADYPLSPNVNRPNLKGVARFFSGRVFQAKVNELLQNYSFSTELAFDVKQTVDFLQGGMKTVIATEVPKA
jgi:hypothetical protein